MIAKVLSANDIGDTKSHQAGILVPKEDDILSFFPVLDRLTKNPRKELIFMDEDGDKWQFFFIYYNNKYFGGTRNEYRLTCMTPYFKKKKLRKGDRVEFFKDGNKYMISSRPTDKNPISDFIKLSNNWITINLK